MGRTLIVEIVDYYWFSLLRVVQQSHRGGEFTPGGETFRTTTCSLRSVSLPAVGSDAASLYVRGSDHTADQEILVVPRHKIDCFISAIRQYNLEFDGDPDCIRHLGAATLGEGFSIADMCLSSLLAQPLAVPAIVRHMNTQELLSTMLYCIRWFYTERPDTSVLSGRADLMSKIR